MISIAKPQISEKEKAAVMKVLDSGMIATGAVTAEFEAAFADYIGAKHGIATTSGTTALEIALRALGIGSGDKVVTTNYSFIASTNSILYTGAIPIFADIDTETFNIDPASAEKALKDNPDAKALLVVHLFGQPCDLSAMKKLADKYDVKLIEDCAQAHGAKWQGTKVGSIGDASAFSFYPTKNMTTGEGGIMLTSDDEVAKKAKILINHGMEQRYVHDIVGYNYRLTNISAAIGIEQLKRLDGFNDARKKHAKYYIENISNPLVRVPATLDGAEPVYHQFTVKVLDNRRADLVAAFEENQIGYGVFYPYTIPEQPAYKDMGFETVWPIADEIKTQVLSLPVHPGLSDEDVSFVTKVINEFR